RPHHVFVDTANWNSGSQAWMSTTPLSSAIFRSDGQPRYVEQHTPDGASLQSEYEYDDVGRPAQIRSWINSGSVETWVYSYEGETSVRIGPNSAAVGPGSDEVVGSFGPGFHMTSSWVTINVHADDYEIPDALALVTTYDEFRNPVECFYFDGN